MEAAPARLVARRRWFGLAAIVLAGVVAMLAWQVATDDGDDAQVTPSVFRATLLRTVDDGNWMAFTDYEHVAGPELPGMESGLSIRGALWLADSGYWLDDDPIECLVSDADQRIEFGVVAFRGYDRVPPRKTVVWLRCL